LNEPKPEILLRHADLPLLTRDAKRYRTYFPSVVMVTPEAQ